MTSNVVLYQNCEILPQELFIVDSIEDYLSTLTKLELTKVQYIRQGLKISIKLDLSQAILDFSNTGYNYCKIQNGTGKWLYYFIVNKGQISSSTVNLDLELDTINTFRSGVDYDVTAKTTIHRQHKDRFTYKTVYDSHLESINILDFSSGISGALPITGFTYYLLKEKMDPVPSPKPYLLIPTTVIKTSDSTLHGIEIKVYSYNEKLRRYTPLLTADDSGSQLGVTIDGQGYIYMTFNGDPYYPLDGEQLVIEWPAFGDFMGNYQTNCTYGNSPANMFYGKLVSAKDWYRNIDINSEGISPILYGEDKTLLEDINSDGNNWYLVYKGATTIQALLIPEYPVTVPFKTNTVLTPSDLTAGSYYYILPERNGVVYMTDSNGNQTSAYEDPWNGDNQTRNKRVICYYLDGAVIKYRTMKYLDLGAGFFHTNSSEWVSTSSLSFATGLTYISLNILGSYTYNTGTIKTGTTSTLILVSTSQELSSFSAFDRTQEDIVKIIKLPYMPLKRLADGSYEKATFNTTNKCLELTSLNTDLSVDLYSPLWWNPYNALYVGQIDTTKNTKDINMESKLFHSDYYQPKVVYDSFSFIFSLERINIDTCSAINNQFGFTFTMTSTINSRFLFTFNEYTTDGKALNNYDNVMYVARNNEVTIYTSAYMSYLKNGFNYDVKSKQRSEVGTWIGFGVTAIGAVASFASGVASAGGAVLAASAAAQLVNAVNHTAQAEANQSQKLQQLRMQANSVYGADDVDLMTKYTGNIAKLMLFKVSDRLKNCLYNLFFYTGYTLEAQGIPNVTSRIRFNFVSCELEMHNVKNMSNDIIKNIKDKYKAGVTVIHKYNGTWDFLQQYENWETALFE